MNDILKNIAQYLKALQSPRRLLANALQPIVANDSLIFVGHSLTIKNAGNTKAIFGRVWTLMPGDCVTISSNTDVFELNHYIVFEPNPSGVNNNRIEMIGVSYTDDKVNRHSAANNSFTAPSAPVSASTTTH